MVLRKGEVMTKRNLFMQFVKQLLPISLLEFLYFIKYRKQKLANPEIYLNTLKNMQGVEIGGPSVVFKGADSCLHCNFKS